MVGMAQNGGQALRAALPVLRRTMSRRRRGREGKLVAYARCFACCCVVATLGAAEGGGGSTDAETPERASAGGRHPAIWRGRGRRALVGRNKTGRLPEHLTTLERHPYGALERRRTEYQNGRSEKRRGASGVSSRDMAANRRQPANKGARRNFRTSWQHMVNAGRVWAVRRIRWRRE